MTTTADFRRYTSFTDSEYIDGLRRSDAKVTKAFFYDLCGFIINDIRNTIMEKRVDYNDLVNEFYIYLCADGWRRLDTFAAVNGCSLKSWASRVAWHYFVNRRQALLGQRTEDICDHRGLTCEENTALKAEIAMDVENTLRRMSNARYVQVLRWFFFDGLDAEEIAERLQTAVTNVYNIKHRAVNQFVEVYTGRDTRR